MDHLSYNDAMDLDHDHCGAVSEAGSDPHYFDDQSRLDAQRRLEALQRTVAPLSEDELADRIFLMLKNESACQPRPDYIENVQKNGMRVVWRSKVANWMLEFEAEYGISQDTIAVAVNYMDRYLSKVSTVKGNMQLLAMAAVYIAAKLHETIPIMMHDLRDLAEGVYEERDIKFMELDILSTVEWRLNPVTPQAVMSHLVQYIVDPAVKGEIYEVAVTFLDVSLPEYEFLAFPPSVIAVAAILSAFEFNKMSPMSWCAAVAHYNIVQNALVFNCRQLLFAKFNSLFPPSADRKGFCDSPVGVESFPEPEESSNDAFAAAESATNFDDFKVDAPAPYPDQQGHPCEGAPGLSHRSAFADESACAFPPVRSASASSNASLSVRPLPMYSTSFSA